jgi:PTH2 family peptidyl-tRNA hydrolase
VRKIYKQAIVVRKDLEWSKGKLAAHVAHASVAATLMADEKTVCAWQKDGSKKVVLKIKDLEEMKKIFSDAKKKKLPSVLISDAGLTQLPKGTVTALAIGPAKETDVDKITGKLKLL